VSDFTVSRRRFLIGSGVLLAAAACTGKPSPPPPPPNSIEDFELGARKLELLSTETPINPGKNVLGFDVLTGSGGVMTGGVQRAYIAQRPGVRAIGPFAARWFPFTAHERFKDQAPVTPLPGTYAVEIDVPAAGRWTLAVPGVDAGQKAVWTAQLTVTTARLPATVGTRALAVRTPVATSVRARREICTRVPPDPMHYISLNDALRGGKPTVVSFATPLLCESRLCGPVVDEQLQAFLQVGAKRANFIHVEEFLPGPDLKPPPAALQNQSPAFKAWGFQTEPWTIVIDRQGVIRGRFEGPVTTPQILGALQPLL
jgi:hypothetical protein